MGGGLGPVVRVGLGGSGGSLRPLCVARVSRHQAVHGVHRVRGGGARAGGHHAHPLYRGPGRTRRTLWPLIIVLGEGDAGVLGAVGGHLPPRHLGGGGYRGGGVRKFLE